MSDKSQSPVQKLGRTITELILWGIVVMFFVPPTYKIGGLVGALVGGCGFLFF